MPGLLVRFKRFWESDRFSRKRRDKFRCIFFLSQRRSEWANKIFRSMRKIWKPQKLPVVDFAYFLPSRVSWPVSLSEVYGLNWSPARLVTRWHIAHICCINCCSVESRSIRNTIRLQCHGSDSDPRPAESSAKVTQSTNSSALKTFAVSAVRPRFGFRKLGYPVWCRTIKLHSRYFLTSHICPAQKRTQKPFEL